MFKQSKIIPIFSYLYMLLPIIIFIIGWCSALISVTSVILIITSFFFVCKNAPKLYFPKNTKGVFFLIGLFLISFIWVYFSGIGALVYQNSDHSCRNPIFELLVTQQWPVILRDESYLGTISPLMLTYYIAFWMPSAIVGKIFHSIQLGYYMQVLWASTGVFLVFYYILSFLKNKTYIPIIIFIFFSGLDVIGANITHSANVYDKTSHLEWWFRGKQFSSFTTQLFWVFNQAIPAWLLTLVCLAEKNNRSLLFLYSCLFLHSTLPAIGIFPYILYLIIKNGEDITNKWFSLTRIKQVGRSMCSVQNIIGTPIIFLISYIYLMNNLSGETIIFWKPDFVLFLLFVILFFSLEVGFYMLIILHYYKREPLFYIILIMFLVYPFIGLGSSYDFCMRGTIPALVILYLLVVKIIDNKQIFENKLRLICLILVLLYGAINPGHEFTRTISNTKQGYIKAESNLYGTNFFAYTDGNKFIKYVSKIAEYGKR